MKAIQHPQFNQQFPEQFNRWTLLESRWLEKLALELVAHCIDDRDAQPGSGRQYVPGLRKALNEIAKIADIQNNP